MYIKKLTKTFTVQEPVAIGFDDTEVEVCLMDGFIENKNKH